MAKISRGNKNIKPFASTSQTGEKNAFGTEANSNTITGNFNDNYLAGFYALAQDEKLSAKDMNGALYAISLSAAILHQQGISQWASEQEYQLHALSVGSNGTIYQSLSASNIGNQLTNTAHWEELIGSQEIADGAITAVKMANNAVTTNKIKNGAINESKIAEGAVGNSALKDGSVTSDKLSSDIQIGDYLESANKLPFINSNEPNNRKFYLDRDYNQLPNNVLLHTADYDVVHTADETLFTTKDTDAFIQRIIHYIGNDTDLRIYVKNPGLGVLSKVEINDTEYPLVAGQNPNPNSHSINGVNSTLYTINTNAFDDSDNIDWEIRFKTNSGDFYGSDGNLAEETERQRGCYTATSGDWIFEGAFLGGDNVIQPNSVGTEELKNGAVTNAKVDGMDASKLKTGTVQDARLSTNIARDTEVEAAKKEAISDIIKQFSGIVSSLDLFRTQHQYTWNTHGSHTVYEDDGSLIIEVNDLNERDHHRIETLKVGSVVLVTKLNASDKIIAWHMATLTSTNKDAGKTRKVFDATHITAGAVFAQADNVDIHTVDATLFHDVTSRSKQPLYVDQFPEHPETNDLIIATNYIGSDTTDNIRTHNNHPVHYVRTNDLVRWDGTNWVIVLNPGSYPSRRLSRTKDLFGDNSCLIFMPLTSGLQDISGTFRGIPTILEPRTQFENLLLVKPKTSVCIGKTHTHNDTANPIFGQCKDITSWFVDLDDEVSNNSHSYTAKDFSFSLQTTAKSGTSGLSFLSLDYNNLSGNQCGFALVSKTGSTLYLRWRSYNDTTDILVSPAFTGSFVTLTYQNNGTDATVKFYQNGVLKNTETSSDILNLRLSGLGDSKLDLSGHGIANDDSNSLNNMIGDCKNFRMFNKALTQAEVTALYNEDKK